MKYRSSFTLGATALGMVAAMLVSMGVSGAFSHTQYDYAPVRTTTSALYMIEENTLRININGASAEALAMLEGIGSTLAERIVEYRQTYGPFESVDDLINVKGIGEGKLSKILDDIYCG